jgi:hypothetical protein
MDNTVTAKTESSEEQRGLILCLSVAPAQEGETWIIKNVHTLDQSVPSIHQRSML